MRTDCENCKSLRQQLAAEKAAKELAVAEAVRAALLVAQQEPNKYAIEACIKLFSPAALIQKVEEDARDAERYRWLRRLPEGIEFRDGDAYWRADCPRTDDLDAAIDAARRAK